MSYLIEGVQAQGLILTSHRLGDLCFILALLLGLVLGVIGVVIDILYSF